MNIFSMIASVLFMFLLVRNVNAGIELRTYEKGQHGEVLYVMKDNRRFMLVVRIVALVLMVVTIVLFILDVSQLRRAGDIDFMQPLALVLGLAILAFAPYSASRWAMTSEGIYIYNSNLFVPWSEMITSGIQQRKHSTIITVQVKKEKSEFLKQRFQLLIVKPEDAERLNNVIHEFIHALDKMKLLKHQKEEKEAIQKKTWY